MSIRRMRMSLAIGCLGLGAVVACGDSSTSSNEMFVSFESNVPTTNVVTTIVPVTTTDSATTMPAVSTTSGESVVEATTTVAVDAMFEQREVLVGKSVEGRPIIARHCQVGTSRPVLAVGSIHGDESAGIRVTEWLCATSETRVDLGCLAMATSDTRLVDQHRDLATDQIVTTASGDGVL
ncbi:MAG: hypothetical protein EBZ93_00500 [Actinobacteria bacterium]|nr:hypothetical protein [Actinomycetota bacterium]